MGTLKRSLNCGKGGPKFLLEIRIVKTMGLKSMTSWVNEMYQDNHVTFC